MRGPERLARLIRRNSVTVASRQIIKRQQQRGDEMLAIGQLQQAPAKQEADRQTADVTEKDLGHRPVERRKPSMAPQQRRRDDGCRGRKFAERPSRSSPPVTGTTSATVIQSSPSMKLTRLTNQRPASSKMAAFDPERTGGNDARDRRAR